MTRSFKWFVSCLVLGIAPLCAHAQYILTFEPSIVSITPGSTATLNLYLNQSGVGTTGSYLSSPGIISVGAMLGYSVTSGTPSRVNSVNDIIPNSAFDQVIEKSLANARDGDVARLQLAVFDNPVVVAPTSGEDANRILVGSFTFTAGSLGSVTTVRLFDPNNPPSAAMNSLFANTVTDVLPDNITTVTLDQFNAITPLYPLSTAGLNYYEVATISVTIPEPASLGLCTLVLCFIGIMYARRKGSITDPVSQSDKAHIAEKIRDV